MSRNNIAIIGGASSLASYLVALLKDTQTVTTFGRQGCDHHLDLTGDVALPGGLDVVVHMGAAFAGEADADILTVFATNAQGALKSCVAAHQAGAKHFIYVSSIYTQLPDDHPYSTAYSLSKTPR